MTISYNYRVGDTVTIQPYSIFDSPRPIEWNADPYGYGKEFLPGETFTYSEPVDIYAQYNPLFINYHLTGETDTGQLVRHDVTYISRIGQRIKIAEFPNISGFKCWIKNDGEIIFPYEAYILTSTIDLFMSCDFDYTLSFNQNGGLGELDSQTKTKHVYIDLSTKQPIQQDALVVLPECPFENKDLICQSWLINGEEYEFGESIVLTEDTMAFASWKVPIQYTLNVKTALINDDFVFQYMMLKIDDLKYNVSNASMSEIQFIDSNNQSFQFPTSTVCSTKNVDSFYLSDPQTNLIDNNTSTNSTFRIEQFPCALIFNFGLRLLDISKYNKFRIWTASDSESMPGRNLAKFQLYFSNNGENWYMADSVENYDLPTQNSSILYESNQLFIATEETELDFDDSDDSDEDEDDTIPNIYVKISALNTNGAAYINTGLQLARNSVKIEGYAKMTSTTGEWNCILGAEESNDSQDSLKIRRTGSDMTMSVSHNNTLTIPIQLNKKFYFCLDANKFVVDTTVKNLSTIYNKTCPSLFLGAQEKSGIVWTGREWKGAIGQVDFYSNDVLVGSFVPVKRKSDSTCGFYNTIDNQFMPSIASTKFSECTDF